MSEVAKARRANDFLVGVTVIVVTVLLVAAVLWVKQADIGGGKTELVARTRDVGNVSAGNAVVIRGVRSGTVKSVSLGDRGWVVIVLDVEKDVPIPPDPVVLLSASSLFGEWQATVTSASGLPADRELRTLIAEARTTGDTLPGATLPDIAQLTSVAGRIAGDVAQVAERVQVAFDDQAARELRESIRNISKVSNELSRTVASQAKSLERITAEVQLGIASVNSAASTVDRIAKRVDTSMTTGELHQLVENSRRAAEELAQTTIRLRAMSEDFDRTQKTMARTVSRVDSVMIKINSGQGSLGMMVNDPGLYRNSDSLVVELRNLLRDVKANPRRYFNLRIF